MEDSLWYYANHHAVKTFASLDFTSPKSNGSHNDNFSSEIKKNKEEKKGHNKLKKLSDAEINMDNIDLDK